MANYIFLPKVHNSLINHPGWPIVAHTDSFWFPLSKFVKKIREQKNPRDLGDNILLLTPHITRLYTNISDKGGLKALRFCFQD